MSVGSKKYLTLNTFRGAGALLVVFYHLFIYFFTKQDIAAWLIDADPVRIVPFYLQALTSIPLSTGHVGVAFFFLMSGFLIVPSLERYFSIKSFIVHKFFRLWPTYAVSLSLGVAFIFTYHRWHGTESPITPDHFLVCLFWVRDLMYYPHIDPVVWTIEIQLKFYLFALIVWNLVRKSFVEKIVIVTLLLSGIVYIIHLLFVDSEWFYFISLARKNLKFYVLILLGTCFYTYYTKQNSLLKTVLLCGILVGTFLSPLFHQSDLPFTLAYLVGSALIGVFVFTDKLRRSKKGVLNHVIDSVASVSYPMYLGHVLPSYTIMFVTVELGYSIYLGLGVSLVYIGLISSLVHSTIEVPFLKLSKALRGSNGIVPSKPCQRLGVLKERLDKIWGQNVYRLFRRRTVSRLRKNEPN